MEELQGNYAIRLYDSDFHWKIKNQGTTYFAKSHGDGFDFTYDIIDNYYDAEGDSVNNKQLLRQLGNIFSNRKNQENYNDYFYIVFESEQEIKKFYVAKSEMHMISDDIRDMEMGDKISITPERLTPEEFDSLKDFDGY